MKRRQRAFLGPTLFLVVVSFGHQAAAQPAPGDCPPQTNTTAIHTSQADTSSTRSAHALAPVIYFYEPYPLEPGSSVFQLGASFSLLPYPDMEQELPIPALDVQYKRGLLPNLAFDGTLSTNIYSNLLHAGLQLHTRIDRFSCGLADHIGGVYGFIKRENVFDRVDAYAIFDMMILRFGYRFEDFSFSLSFVATYVFKSQSHVNGMEAPGGPEGSINDYWVTWAIEQPFLRSLHLSIGMSLGYTRTPYQTWMLYNTTDEWLFAPEFFFSIQP